MPAPLDLTIANSHLLERLEARVSVFLSPFHLDKLMEGVLKEMHGYLLSYLDDREGVLLSFSPPKIVGPHAALCQYPPYLNVQVDTELLLLKPLPGDILVGRAHGMSAGTLNLLVLGGINACIDSSEMPGGFAYDAENGVWVPGGDYSRAIMRGDIVACRVLSPPMFDPQGEELIFSLDASLVGDHTGLTPHQSSRQQQKRARLVETAAQNQHKKPPKAQDKKAQKKAKKVQSKQQPKQQQQQRQQQQQQRTQPLANGVAAAGIAALLAKPREQLSKAERKQLKEHKRSAKAEKRKVKQGQPQDQQQQKQQQHADGPAAQQQQQQQPSKQSLKRKQGSEAVQPAGKKQKYSGKEKQQQAGKANGVVAAGADQQALPAAANKSSTKKSKKAKQQ